MIKDVVRDGYDAIGVAYSAERQKDQQSLPLVRELIDRLLTGADVLDAGCGSGVPVTMALSNHFDVTGVDISETQLELARRSIPHANFVCRDMTELDFPAGSFDAICSFYAIIHIPREEHGPLLLNFQRMLKPGGLLLVCMGASDWPGEVEEFYGAPMYWSHFDAQTNLRMVREAGFAVIWSRSVADMLDPENASVHLFVLARQRTDNQG